MNHLSLLGEKGVSLMQIKNVPNESSVRINTDQMNKLNMHSKVEQQANLNKNFESDEKEKTGAVKSVKDELIKATNELKEAVNVFNRKIDFSVHDDTKRLLVKVVDSETGDVLREIPPEEMLDLVAKMQKTLGLLVDEKV